MNEGCEANKYSNQNKYKSDNGSDLYINSNIKIYLSDTRTWLAYRPAVYLVRKFGERTLGINISSHTTTRCGEKGEKKEKQGSIGTGSVGAVYRSCTAPAVPRLTYQYTATANFISSPRLFFCASRKHPEAPSVSTPSASQPANSNSSNSGSNRLYRISDRASSSLTGGSDGEKKGAEKKKKKKKSRRADERKSERDPAGIGNAKCTDVYPSSFSGDSKSFTARCQSGIHLAPSIARRYFFSPPKYDG